MWGLPLVDLGEFLPDRLSLTCQLEDWVAPANLLPSSHPSLSEVSLVQFGFHFFVMYMYVVVLTEARPELANSRMVYLALVMAAARANGGDG